MSEVNLQTGGFCGYSFGKESLALKKPPSLWQCTAACQVGRTASTSKLNCGSTLNIPSLHAVRSLVCVWGTHDGDLPFE